MLEIVKSAAEIADGVQRIESQRRLSWLMLSMLSELVLCEQPELCRYLRRVLQVVAERII